MNNRVFIVDDDMSVRDALGLMLSLHGYQTSAFADARSFLDTYRPSWRGCLLIDIRMPGLGGLELQQRLQDIGCRIPTVIITGHGDVASARQAFRADAIDFLEKPLDEQRLIQAIEEAFARQRLANAAADARSRLASKLAGLTPREREVMELVVAGRHNRDIADTLGISVRTVEVHKSRMMAKLEADSVADLVRLSLSAADG
jgi:FixJ family two-component response regulator